MSNEEPKNLSNIDKLFTLEVYSHGAEEDKIFLGALKDELIFHYENNKMYRSFCDKKGFSPYSDFGIEDIPPVSVSVFKNLGDSLGSVPINDTRLQAKGSLRPWSRSCSLLLGISLSLFWLWISIRDHSREAC